MRLLLLLARYLRCKQIPALRPSAVQAADLLNKGNSILRLPDTVKSKCHQPAGNRPAGHPCPHSAAEILRNVKGLLFGQPLLLRKRNKNTLRAVVVHRRIISQLMTSQ